MSKPFFVTSTKGKPSRPGEAVDVAARYLVYKLYDATSGARGAWLPLNNLGEQMETLARAAGRGWVVVEQGAGGKGSSASLTDEGRRMARKGLRS
jgi:hypothetical protein